MKKLLVLLLALALARAPSATDARAMVAGSVSGPVSSYIIATPDIGSCRLQGVSSTSDNFKFFASVSARDATLHEGCARCIKVTRDDDASKSVTAYVLDVAQSAAAGSLRLSTAALQTLAVDANSNNVSVSYKFVGCPAAFASGNVRACLMEGASNAYIPLQFSNAQKVIASVKINGVQATSPKESYLFSATSGQSKEGASTWYSNLAVEMTSVDNETLSGTFSFGAPSGCATYTAQFSAASTATDGADIAGGGGADGDSDALVPALVGGIGALFLLIGSVFLIRRRRMARAGGDVSATTAAISGKDHDDDLENQYLEPKGGKPQPSPAGPTYVSDRSDHGESHSDPELRSPTIDYSQSYSPAAAVSSMVALPQRSLSPAGSQSVSSSSGSGSNYSYRKPPTYSFSSNVSSSPRLAKGSAAAPTVPTFQAPVVPTYSAAPLHRAPSYEHPGSQSFSDEEEQVGRSSFDIDDMRNTEEMKATERGDDRFSAFGGGSRATQTYPAAASASYGGEAVVTSPQSYVRATSLRRNTATRTPSAYRSDPFDGSSAGYGQQQERQHSGTFAPPGSLRETSGGYSRDSLSILGYPYAKKSGRNSSATEAHF